MNKKVLIDNKYEWSPGQGYLESWERGLVRMGDIRLIDNQLFYAYYVTTWRNIFWKRCIWWQRLDAKQMEAFTEMSLRYRPNI